MVVLVVLLGVGWVLAQEQLTEEAIREGALEWQELFNQGDWEALAQRYAEDAVFYGFDGMVHEGREAIRDSLAEPLPGDPENPQIEVTVDAVYILEDAWVDVGSWVIRAQDGSEILRGNYMGFGRLVNGQPLIVRHMANMVLPEGMMGEQDGN
jgi:uncharacterized protein (TIGR02246 family)